MPRYDEPAMRVAVVETPTYRVVGGRVEVDGNTVRVLTQQRVEVTTLEVTGMDRSPDQIVGETGGGLFSARRLGRCPCKGTQVYRK